MFGTWFPCEEEKVIVKNDHNQELPSDVPEGTLPPWKIAPLQWLLVARV